ncbi:MAG: mannose-1-phosphate guanylyltransferase [Anaerolineae bacterium]|nr:mannose-1-phosphate guanylyltransferase [Anaerolineae bacterium]
MSNAYVVIMAGGYGTRLWPLSRQSRPKPLLPLVEESRSMFQISVERLYPLFTPERILVVTGEEMMPSFKEQVPDLPDENFIVEPVGRNTAPAVGLGAIHIRQRDPDAVMAILTADHYIRDVVAFRRALSVASRVAEQGEIVTLGIKPTFAATGFGYIEKGSTKETIDDIAVYHLQRFVEKPDQATAEEFVASGDYSWNSGMFIWSVRRVMAEFELHAPDLSTKLEQLAAAIGQPDYQARLGQIWPTMQKISVDYALMEHIHEGISVIPIEMGWSDIGNFKTLYDILSAGDDDTHVISGHEPIVIDGKRLLIFSQRLVAAIGIEDMVIIDTDDVLLVCPRDRAQDVKKLVETLKRNEQNEYL